MNNEALTLSLAVFGEAHCPDTMRFVRNQLRPSWDALRTELRDRLKARSFLNSHITVAYVPVQKK